MIGAYLFVVIGKQIIYIVFNNSISNRNRAIAPVFPNIALAKPDLEFFVIGVIFPYLSLEAGTTCNLKIAV